MKLFKTIALSTCCLVLAACTKDFLSTPIRTVSINDLMSANDGGLRMLGSVYANLYSYDLHGFSWIGIASITSDDADKGSTAGDAGADKNLMDNWTFSPSSLSFNDVWKGNYAGVGKATAAMTYLAQMTQISDADKQRYIAECKFIRAYNYFNLVRCFGGVPLIIKILESQADIDAASVKTSAANIYAQIEKDLNEAAPNLPLTIPSAENGRVSKGAALALLAKAYLYQQKWSLASSTAASVIVSNQYSLVSNFADMWKVSGEFGSESVWELNCIGSLSYGDQRVNVPEWCKQQAPRGHTDPNVMEGWGFNSPSQQLYNAFNPADVRRAASIKQMGDLLWDGNIMPSNAGSTYFNYKTFISKTLEWGGDEGLTNKNIRMIRYADVLLIKAEADCELNQLSAATTNLNLIRSRAGLPNTLALTQTQLRDSIFNERRLEFAMEFERTFDLRRTGRDYAAYQAAGKTNFTRNKHELFPIPQEQIDKTGGRLIQNVGY